MGRSAFAADLARRVFPGRKFVWIGAGVALVVVGVLGLRLLTATTGTLTGTNSVGVGTVIADAKPGERTCIRDLVVPANTGQVGVWLFGQQIRPGAKLEGWVESRTSGRIPIEPTPLTAAADFAYLPLARTVEEDLADAEVCIVSRRAVLGLGGASVQRLVGDPVSSVGRRDLVGLDVAVRFALPAGMAQSFGGEITTALERSTVFEPLVGKVLTFLAIPVLLLLLYFVVRVGATAGDRTVRWLAVAACGVAFAHATTWSVLLHPLHGADESEHFAYAQHLAASGDRPDESATSKRPPYSSAEERLMAALHHNSTTLNPSSRPRWDKAWEQRLEDGLTGASSSDGGGYTESGTGHGPLYYSVVGIPLRVLDAPSQQLDALLAMRLMNALIASLVAGCAVLVASLFMPRRQELQWLAGCLAGLQPVFGSVAGAVNNDTAVNVVAALTVLVLSRSLILGPTARRGVLVGVAAVALPLAKITGFELIPVIGVAAVLLVVRYGAAPTARWLGAAVSTGALALVVWIFVLSPLSGGGRGDLVYRHPPVAAATGVPAPVGPPPPPTAIQKLEYVVQTFVPTPTIGSDRFQLPGATSLQRWPAFRIYIDRGYGLYGWKSTNLSIGMQRGIFFGLVLAWGLALVALFRLRSKWREWLPAGLLLAATVGSVLLFVSWAYATTDVRTDLGEQGRYIFPALVPLSVLLASGGLAFKSQTLRLTYAGAATLAVAGLALIAWLTALRGWFT